MARKRDISPGLWENEEFVEMSPAARLVWIGLWSVCDRHGCFEWRPRKWTRLFAAGIPCKGEEVFQELLAAGFVERYKPEDEEGDGYGFVVKWAKHQDPHPQEKAVYPTPNSPNYCPKGSGRKQPANLLQATGQQPASNLLATGKQEAFGEKPPASRLPATSLPPSPSFPSFPSFPSRPSDEPRPSSRPTPTGEGVGEGGWEPVNGLEDPEEGQKPPKEESWHLGEVLRVCPDRKRGQPEAVKAAWAVVLAQGEVTERELCDCVKALIRSFLPGDGREDRVQWLTRLDLLLTRGQWRSLLASVRAQHAETTALAERLAREPPPAEDDALADALADLSPEPILLEPLTRGA